MLHLLATEGQIQGSETAAGVTTVWLTAASVIAHCSKSLVRGM
jgi:hypothetical protein